ncbi:prolactin-releasing peptide receptor-like [Neodiprion lecontei]|uniref:Prolactin-releasing peptide receptor-like n=1 Tax=Neodiprion lecontei TaxID=441921 RepID=A0A6J0C5T4_NEOLC|nr:prolactin-releasing peptide receptor-like [Neodiprion lecontei]XP_046594484.1 prolactin-releasing peptide receptor-like [Neodiprion lecontei]XP_046594485.1 prolactin-releasing peptide receptor-like [Neodiprion lecontei]XP_046594486.1 prolactin-releasing peptide receptor-like [Neodiprion lecontei]XP_046594487.1 prolactin-releasing peptide receptor-like [Neodiprion lecontei]XP_046594488.1 prolactin-releasing peptide receptor-like [Neodiprion lecontei]XP_046594489.1 prolactin-releasing peptid
MGNASEVVVNGNNTSFEYPDWDLTANAGVQAAFCILYGNIFVLGLCGNALVCFVVARNRQMQTVTNLFITNLALSDVLLCILAVPFTPLYTFLGGWVFGNTLCHLVPYAQGASIYISTLTLTGIAVDRFSVIIYPFRPRMRVEACLAIIAGIWVVALVLTLPYGIYMQLQENRYKLCEENWPSEDFRMVFSSLTSILQFVLPFFVIAYCYVCVSVRLNDRAKAKPGSKTSRREEADKERKRRTNRMLIAMVSIFGVSWLPLNIVNVLNDFYLPVTDWSYYRLCFFMTHCLAMSSTCYNPFLYAWLNENFRKEFKQVIPCFRRAYEGRNPNGKSVGGLRTERTCDGEADVDGNGVGIGVEAFLEETLLRVPDANATGSELVVLDRSTGSSSDPKDKRRSVALRDVAEDAL